MREEPSFGRMCRAFPVRTGVFTVGPVAVGLAQVGNALVHGSAVWPVAAVAALMGAFSVLVTRYHLSAFRRRALSTDSGRPGTE